MQKKTIRIKYTVISSSLFLLFALSAEAKVYKCVDSAGGVEYSQIPCSADQESQKVFTSATSKPAQESCAAVRAFAVDIAERMRSGTAVDVEINSNGGINGISKPALNIINYVYSFRVNKNTSNVRIASLVQAKCSNGAFGKVEHSDLPKQYDPNYKADEDADNDKSVEPQVTQQPDSTSEIDTDQLPMNLGDNDLHCEQLKQQIEAIDEKSRGSYSSAEGDQYRQQRWDLRRELRKNCK